MYKWQVTLNDAKMDLMWNLEPSGKVMNIEAESSNGILHVMNDRIKFDWLERHHIFLRKVMMNYLCRHCKVALEDLFGRVNVIGLWTLYGNPLYEP